MLALNGGLVPGHGEAVSTGARGQDLTARLSHEESVLELRGTLAIGCHRRPAVRPCAIGGAAAQVDHGLDRKDVPRTHDALSLVLLVVWHVGRRVKELTNAMTAVCLDNGALVLRRDLADRIAQIAVQGTRCNHVERRGERLVRALDHAQAVVIDLAYKIRLVQVRVKSLRSQDSKKAGVGDRRARERGDMLNVERLGWNAEC